jgi:hypothetical protein
MLTIFECYLNDVRLMFDAVCPGLLGGIFFKQTNETPPYYNILVKKARDAFDADTSAENGVGPWKLGMLSAALLLWDILWSVVVVEFREQKLLVKAEHVERAFMLLQIQDGLRNAFRELKGPEGAKTSVSQGRDFEGLDATGCVKHTELVRRLLTRASRGSSGEGFQVHSKQIFRIFPKAEKSNVKASVFLFRKLAGQCPETIGSFDVQNDCLQFALPPPRSKRHVRERSYQIL